MSARINDAKIRQALDECKRKTGGIHFYRIVFQLFWKRILFVNVVQFFKTCVSLAEPLVFARFIRWIKGATTLSDGIRFGLSVAFVVVLRAFFRTIYIIGARGTSRRIIAGFSSLLYRAVERGGLTDSVLPRQESKCEPSLTALVMSDLHQAVSSLQMWHQLWSSPMQIIGGLVLIHTQTGALPIACASVFIAISYCLLFCLTEYSRKVRRTALRALDEHSKCVAAALDTMPFVKASGLEPESAEEFDSLFQRAFKLGSRSDHVTSLVQTTTSGIPLMAQVILSVIVLFTDKELVVGAGFAAITFLQSISSPLSWFPRTISTVRNGAISAHRVEQALEIAEQYEPPRRALELPDGEIELHFDVETAAEQDDPLRPARLHVGRGQRVAIMGPVGSGKSSLLLALLNETDYRGHGGAVGGRHVGYMGQIPWFFAGSVRQNVMATCGPVPEPPPQRYLEAVGAAQLQYDIQTVIDDTVDHPATAPDLSGGQRARVALARVLYSDAPVLLLDDAFVQLDARVSSCAVAAILNRRTALPIAADRTIVIATQNPRQAALCDTIICLSAEGGLLAVGSPMKLIAEAGGVIKTVFGKEGARNFARVVAGSSFESPVETDTGQRPSDVQHRCTPEPVASDAAHDISWRRFFKVVFPTRAYEYLYLIASLLFHQISRVRQDLFSIGITGGSQHSRLVSQSLAALYILGSDLVTNLCAYRVSKNAYQHLYHRVLKRVLHSPLIYLTGVGKSAAHLILTTECSDIDQSVRALYSFSSKAIRITFSFGVILLASGWQFSLVTLVLLRHVVGLVRSHRAAAARMQNLQTTAPRAYISHFTQTMQGSAVIRALGVEEDFFSRFCETFDAIQRPNWHSTMLQQLLTVRAEFLAALLALGVAASAIVCVFGRPIGAIWRECRAGSYRSFASCLQAQPLTGLSGSATSLALARLIRLGNQLVALLETSSSVDVQRHAVGRLVDELDQMDQEAAWRAQHGDDATCEKNCGDGCVAAACRLDASEDWTGSRLDIERVTLRYPCDELPAIKDVSLSVAPGEHLAIVGRTGAGKTSLVTAILRLTEPSKGTISLGGRDLSQVGLHDLRRRIAIVPQGALLPPFPIRTALSAGQASDESIWKVLDDVGVGDVVRSHGGLDGCLPQSLSAGQRQLVCVARALLRCPSLVILDEATACLDSDAEARVLAAVGSLPNVPIVSVCHSLAAAGACDRVAVMSDGRLVEQGRPDELAQRPDSFYAALLRADHDGVVETAQPLCD